MQRVAIVGSGIAGLGAAWLLREHAQITVFEAATAPGGHVQTVMVGDQPVDTGFIVCNDRNYPYFMALLDELGVATQASDMSFGVSIGAGAIEWAGDNLGALFAQKSLLVDRGHWQMLRDILRFNRQAKAMIAQNRIPAISLGAFLDRNGYGEAFSTRYVLPMGAAIWSTPTADMRAFPVATFLHFFDHHGLLDRRDRPQWRTVVGGSHRYVRAIAECLGPRLRLASPVAQVTRGEAGACVMTDAGRTEVFDQVIFACHADTTRAILTDADADERAILGAFGFQSNRALLHSDPALMPRRRAVWSSWNYIADRDRPSAQRVSVSYWMNRLQNIAGGRDYFVTLNPLVEPAAHHVIREIAYEHPVFDSAAIAAQQRLPAIQGRGGIWHCGAWCGHGFHEDGLAAAVRVAAGQGMTAPWRDRAPARQRL